MKIVVTRFEPFPNGTATAFRAFTLCKMLADLGNDVIVVAPQINENRTKGLFLNCDLRIRAYGPNDILDNSSFENAAVELIKKENPDLVLRSTTIKYFYKINKEIKKRNIPLIYDSVEWYDTSNWRFGRIDPRYWLFQYLWRTKFIKSDGIIAISRMIEDYYKKYLNNVIRIPTVIDCANYAYSTNVSSDNIIKFVFAGKLDNNKDRLVNFVEAIDSLGDEASNIRLDIFGPSIEDLSQQFKEKFILLKKHNDKIFIHGLVSQEEVRKGCLNSDFSVFFRLNRRSANAGFPTKLGECLSAGTPAFCNNTGDISLVLKNKQNGILLSNGETETIVSALKYTISLSVNDREKMRYEARKSAELFFDYHNYMDKLNTVISNAINNRGGQ